MNLGILMSLINQRYFRDKLSTICEFIPQVRLRLRGGNGSWDCLCEAVAATAACVLSCAAGLGPMLQAAAQGVVRHEQMTAASTLRLWQGPV